MITLMLAGCLTVDAHAQRGGGARGGGGFAGGAGHASMGGGGFRGAGALARPQGSTSFRGYGSGMRPSLPIARYGTRSALGPSRFAGNLAGARAGYGQPFRPGTGRPSFFHRDAGASRSGTYGYGRPYGFGGRGGYPYRGYGYPVFPYFGLAYSPFLPGFLGWDLDWDTLGRGGPGWDGSLGYDPGYDPGYGSGYADTYAPGASGTAYEQQAYPEAQPVAGNGGYDAQALPPDAQASRPSPLLPDMGPGINAPSRERVTTLIFKDGRPPEQIRNYALTRASLFVTGPSMREIPLDELNLPATEQVNRQAGVNFQLP